MQSLVQALACRACLVTDFSEDFVLHFEPGRHFAVFSTPEQVVEKVAALLADDQTRSEIAREGYERAVSTFSFDARVRTLVHDYSLLTKE